MAALPDSANITGSAVTQGGLRTALDQLRSYLAGLLGTDGVAATARTTLGLTSAAVTSIADIGYALLAQGTKAVFSQASAPIGWTQDTAVNDKVLRLVNTVGGGTGGSWTISGLSASVSVTVATHVLTSLEIPATAVKYSGPYAGDGNEPDAGTMPMLDTGAGSASNISWGTVQGGGGAHGHSGSTGSATIGADGTWRPAYADVLVAAKD